MPKKYTTWRKLNLTVSGSQAGDLLAAYFGSETYRKYNRQPWNFTYYNGDRTLLNLDEFKEFSLRFDAEINFNIT